MKLSLLIPVYNAEQTLERCLLSVIPQPIDKEILLIDDGSKDNSLRIAQRFAHECACIRVIETEHRGVSAARNVALKEATGDWLVFLDADDLLVQNSVARVMPLLEQDYDAVCGKILRGKSKGLNTEWVGEYGEERKEEFIHLALSNPTDLLTCHAWFFRRSTWEKNQETFDCALTLGEDSDWILRQLSHCSKVFLSPIPVYRYSINTESTIHLPGKDREKDYLDMLAIMGNKKAGQEKGWSAFVLITFILILMHCTFRTEERLSLNKKLRKARNLRDLPLFQKAFATADLSQVEKKARFVLLLAKKRWMWPVWICIRLRQKQNVQKSL